MRVLLAGLAADGRTYPLIPLAIAARGSGTTLGALSAGVPRLMPPQGAGQFASADAVTSTPACDCSPAS
ncbi:hypothetical protein ABGB18_24815 [Nonomuraea sp. B12E4]|uniref:hypothetical protein n=1 Tax=Nonomuraea sp. B12E4 TaxID=3153564 RepID=UPI00325DA854